MGKLNAAQTMIQAAEGGFEAPSMAEFFPSPFAFVGTPFEMNRVMLIRILATLAVVILLAVWAKRMKLIPTRFQSAMEIAMEFVTVGIAEDTMGKEKAKKFMPLIVAIFFGVLFWNVTKLIPFLNMPAQASSDCRSCSPRSSTSPTTGRASREGPRRLPQGCAHPPRRAVPMHFLLIPIEFITKFVTQPFTLAIRLFANMMVGHLLLVLCFSATSFFLFDASNGFQFFAILTFAGGFFVFLLEMLVVVLQAYIFALLSCVYINAAISEDH